jgi:hypothetical protein
VKAVDRYSGIEYWEVRHVLLHKTGSGQQWTLGGAATVEPFILSEKIRNLESIQMIAFKALK